MFRLSEYQNRLMRGNHQIVGCLPNHRRSLPEAHFLHYQLCRNQCLRRGGQHLPDPATVRPLVQIEHPAQPQMTICHVNHKRKAHYYHSLHQRLMAYLG